MMGQHKTKRDSLGSALVIWHLQILLFLAALVSGSAQAEKISQKDAAHLLQRTSFAVDAQSLVALQKLGKKEAVEKILNASRNKHLSPLPAWFPEYLALWQKIKDQKRMMGEKMFGIPDFNPEEMETTLNSMRAKLSFVPPQMDKAMKRVKDSEFGPRKTAMIMNRVALSKDFQAWWFKEMIETDTPFSERMTLFWHNHFTTSVNKVRNLSYIYEQNQKLRKHALGSFRDMLFALSKDPAMLIYLDGEKNKKGAPNENFAREVMELFTVGEGNYTEQDIREAARAFTGWAVNRKQDKFVFRKFQHDSGPKTIFGKTGNFTGEDVLNMLLERKETAYFVTRKAWLAFISPEPNAAEIQRIGDIFYKDNYSIKTLMREILLSDAFYAAKGSLIKSPVELIVGTFRQFNLRPKAYLPLAYMSTGLGQELFAPPNVKGWPGGKTWITTDSIIQRKGWLSMLFRPDNIFFKLGRSKMERTVMEVMPRLGTEEQQAWKNYIGATPAASLLLPGTYAQVESGKSANSQKSIQQLIFEPAFQLR